MRAANDEIAITRFDLRSIAANGLSERRIISMISIAPRDSIWTTIDSRDGSRGRQLKTEKKRR